MSPSAGRPPLKQIHAVGVEPRNLGDPGASGNILTHQAGFINLVTGGAETRTLDDPKWVGQKLQLNFETDGGNCVITADSAINQTGNTIMTFADAGDHIELVGARDGAGDFEWRVIANDGVALS
tara:strand:- start:337 stop:708 length:372 start_codon:yes stop_codon:yes gene_type:complete